MSKKELWPKEFEMPLPLDLGEDGDFYAYGGIGLLHEDGRKTATGYWEYMCPACGEMHGFEDVDIYWCPIEAKWIVDDAMVCEKNDYRPVWELLEDMGRN